MTSWVTDIDVWCDRCEEMDKMRIQQPYSDLTYRIYARCSEGHTLASIDPANALSLRLDPTEIMHFLYRQIPARPLTPELAFWIACTGTEL